MAAIASTARPRSGTARPTNEKRSLGAWVMIGVPVLLGLLFIWQFVSPLLRSEIISHTAVAVSRVTLESDPLGARIAMVVVDRTGTETSVNGELSVKVREPDGAVWENTRTISSGDFGRLPGTGLLNGRVGYSLVVPADDWVRAPRRGGSATVTVTVRPADGGEPFSTISEERFP